MEDVAAIRIRIINIDFCMTAPVAGLDIGRSPFAPSSECLPKVPVIRVFGATPAGQKACVHVHQVFPYFYIEYKGSLESAAVYRHIYQLGRSINHALAISLKIQPEKADRAQFVAAILPVKGIPYYGFHSQYTYFLKIYIVDPGLLNRVVDLLSKGVVMGKRFQTFESHIPYLPQFFIDHNLLGMDYMDLANFRFRLPLKDCQCAKNGHEKYFTSANTPQDLLWPESMRIDKESFCELELDVVAGDILNRNRIKERPTKALIDLVNGAEISDTKLVPSLQSLWEDERRRRIRRNMEMPPTPPLESDKPLPKTQQALLNEWFDRIEKIRGKCNPNGLSDEDDSRNGSRSSAEKYCFAKFPKDSIPTVFSAVSALYFSDVDDLSGSDGDIEALTQLSRAFDLIKEAESRLNENRPDLTEERFEVNIEILSQSIAAQDSENAQDFEIDSEDDYDVDVAEMSKEKEDQDEDENFWNETDFANVLEAANNQSNRSAETLESHANFPTTRKTTTKNDQASDMENLCAERAFDSEDFDEFDDMDSEELRLQVLAIEEYERQQIARIANQEDLMINTLADMDRRLPSNSASSSYMGQIDQVDGPASPPVSERDRKRKRTVRSMDMNPQDMDAEDIDDFCEGAKPASRIIGQVKRNSLNIQAPQTAEKSKKKTVSFTVSSATKDIRFKSAPKLKVNPASSEILSPNTTRSSNAAKRRRRESPELNDSFYKASAFQELADDELITETFDTAHLEKKIPQIAATDSFNKKFEVNFISKLDEMWSPQRPVATNWSFFNSPPVPSSPTKMAKESGAPIVQSSSAELNNSELASSATISSSTCDSNDLCGEEPIDGSSFEIPICSRSQNVFRLKHHPPTLQDLNSNWYGETERNYKSPYFSNIQDAVGAGKKLFAHQRFYVSSDVDQSRLTCFSEACSYKHQFIEPGQNILVQMNELKARCGLGNPARPFVKDECRDLPLCWKLAYGPPSTVKVASWLKSNPVDAFGSQERKLAAQKASQLEGPTPKNQYGYKYSQIQTEALSHELQHLVMMSLEVLTRAMTESERVLSRLPKIKLPDPARDAILAVFYCFQGHKEEVHRSNGHRAGYHVGMIIVDDLEDALESKPLPYKFNGISGFAVTNVSTELDLFAQLVLKIREFDPDVLLGYEVHLSSWGYVIERAKIAYELDILKECSRMQTNIKTKFGRDEDPFAYKGTCAIACSGRIFLNVWRLMRGELNLTNYSLENTVFHVLHQRIAKFSPATLYSWFAAKGLKRWRSLVYYLDRVQFSLELLDDTSFVSRSCEFARVYGIDLFSVISRGSQYRVESIMSRITRPENFVQFSPTKDQVRSMRAIECLPLILEPKTQFYKDPVAVLDFQSLYPSVMIGYNICYSTCLGRLRDVDGAPKKFGAMELLDIPMDLLIALRDHVLITHNGVVFVKSYVREGTLGRMLKEILDTRVMIKTCMKAYKQDPGLVRILEARQLGLKLVANVTYGYCGASYSGRMPCAEIADSIVETGRRALEQAMRMVKENFSNWGGTVVYGDTDSMFVELPGRSLESAFRIGLEIAIFASMRNPIPMKLKFEKIYLPCILLAKKRYVGFMYESLDDKVPAFDAKGIETVRRDGFPAMAKMVENSLKILFRTQDMSELKAYLYRQWDRILTHRVALDDLIIATEFKLKNYKNLPPGVTLAVKSIEYDKRTEPQGGERVPYIICEARNTNHAGRSHFPADVARDRTLNPDGQIYVGKTIQALSRIFNLLGIDIESWFQQMPRKNTAVKFAKKTTSNPVKGQFKIDQFYRSNMCLICKEMTESDTRVLCQNCRILKCQETLLNLKGQLSELERKRCVLHSVCRSCSQQSMGMALPDIKCISTECPVFYRRMKSDHEYKAKSEILEVALAEVVDLM